MEQSHLLHSPEQTVSEQSKVQANKNRIIDELNREARSVQAFTPVNVNEFALIQHIMMQDVVGDYDTPDTVPEWAWIEANASFQHRENGKHGIWEFVVNLARHFDDVPEKLRTVLESAKRCGVAYLVFHQGT